MSLGKTRSLWKPLSGETSHTLTESASLTHTGSPLERFARLLRRVFCSDFTKLENCDPVEEKLRLTHADSRFAICKHIWVSRKGVPVRLMLIDALGGKPWLCGSQSQEKPCEIHNNGRLLGGDAVQAFSRENCS